MRHPTLRRALFAAVAATVVVALGSVALVTAWLAGWRVPVASGAVWMRVEKLAAADNAGAPDGVFFIALIGNDHRPGLGGARGDALHVVGVNPAARTATIVNIPRDTCWGGGKINRVHNQTGPRGQADALGELLGVPVSYVVSADFAGFQAIVDGVGGVDMDIPFRMDDKNSGAFFEPGPNHLDGFHALALSRNRYDFPNGDIQRTENQGMLILAGLRKLQAEASSAAGEFRVAALLARHTQVDGMGLTDVYRLGRVAHRLDPNAVRNVTLPVGGGGCLSVSAAAAPLLADFRDDATLQSH
jgi:LCP family protein required for cell wall assembly